jgi:hypothetical protein
MMTGHRRKNITGNLPQRLRGHGGFDVMERGAIQGMEIECPDDDENNDDGGTDFLEHTADSFEK